MEERWCVLIERVDLIMVKVLMVKCMWREWISVKMICESGKNNVFILIYYVNMVLNICVYLNF